MIDRRQSSFSFRGQSMTSFLQSSSDNMEWKLETRTADSDFSVILADGRPQQKHRPVCTVPLTVKIADESEKQSFTTFPLARNDVLSGRPWLAKNNPQIKFQTIKVRIGLRPPWTARLIMIRSGITRRRPGLSIELHLTESGTSCPFGMMMMDSLPGSH